MQTFFKKVKTWFLEYLQAVRQLRREMSLLRSELHEMRNGIQHIQDYQRRVLQDLQFLRARSAPAVKKY